MIMHARSRVGILNLKSNLRSYPEQIQDIAQTRVFHRIDKLGQFSRRAHKTAET
eukprot:SAG11_NODE_8838_length_971_cov_1.502294_1_plen_53_part_10